MDSESRDRHMAVPKLNTVQHITNESKPVRSLSTERLDAGLRSLDHYKNKLPSWRYSPRQRLIPFVRLETPYLALLQKSMRSSTLDTYFSITANLGTHTFFMVFLPMLFWCGYADLGRDMVHILASGVFFTGVLKDMLCLPRPLSPPLHRITLSESAALEYGFPSTHTTNAVSVAVYALFALNSPDSTVHPKAKLPLEIAFYAYATSIMLGRLYCGMHGFFDVLIGAILGAMISIIQCVYGNAFDIFVHTGPIQALALFVVIILILVRIHPEPADDCPCFDDSVAFAGVMIGIELGYWHYTLSGLAWDDPVPATAPFELEALGWPRTIARIVVGVLMIFAWREVMKPALLKALPPVFRIVEKLGLSLPRRFFKQASEYNKVPNIREDNVIPSIYGISSLFATIRHPRKSRSVSVGPQSEADAYETIAYREKRRRESLSEMADIQSIPEEKNSAKDSSNGYFGVRRLTNSNARNAPGMLPTPASSKLDLFEQMTGTESVLCTPTTPTAESAINGFASRRPSDDRRQYEREEREMFSKLEKPRVRYDVEVITKLIVYVGIGWLAVEGNPILFDYIGLGLGRQQR